MEDLSTSELEKLKYPIGKFRWPKSVSDEDLKGYVREIKSLPEKLDLEVSGLSETQLSTPYRPGGWTVRQTINHIFDSHINSYTRFKLALTEDKPIIRGYEEADWAELADGQNFPVNTSLQMIKNLHHRWVYLLESLTDEQWNSVFIHPEMKKEISLKSNAALYDWHGNHHLAHITQLKKRSGW